MLVRDSVGVGDCHLCTPLYLCAGVECVGPTDGPSGSRQSSVGRRGAKTVSHGPVSPAHTL